MQIKNNDDDDGGDDDDDSHSLGHFFVMRGR